MSGFRQFMTQTNALALAIGVIIGGAVGKVVASLVDDILMPPIGLLVGNVDFSGLFLNLGGGGYATIDEARKAGAPTLNYGLFISALVDFLVIALCVYFLTRAAMRLAPAPAGPAMKQCPECGEPILQIARRCRHCTSAL